MKVLFLCSANQCRSPLAESILRSKLIVRGLTDVAVESASIFHYEDEPRDYTMVSYARKAGYEMGGFSRYITQDAVDSADLIICMEYFQVVEVQKRFVPYVRWGCIHRFNEICFGEQTDVIDPTGDSGYIYSEILKHIENGCSTLCWKIDRMIRYGEDLINI